jgi:hypothetical protein
MCYVYIVVWRVAGTTHEVIPFPRPKCVDMPETKDEMRKAEEPRACAGGQRQLQLFALLWLWLWLWPLAAQVPELLPERSRIGANPTHGIYGYGD